MTSGACQMLLLSLSTDTSSQNVGSWTIQSIASFQVCRILAFSSPKLVMVFIVLERTAIYSLALSLWLRDSVSSTSSANTPSFLASTPNQARTNGP